jgi:hypothetical protein
MLRIGEGFEGAGAHSAHVHVLRDPNSLVAAPFALAEGFATRGNPFFTPSLR